MMRVMLRVNQCRHVMMGPCLDNGYLPFLSEYKGQPFAAGRITLIEMTPSTPGFHALGFRMTSMPNVFRSQPLPDKSVNSLPVRPASTSTDGAAVPTPSGSSVSPPSDHTAASWAALGKNGLPSKTINVAPKKPAPPRFYLVNKHGERLDEELPRWDPNAEKRFSKRIKETGNMCNNYQLRGRCPDGEFCPYDHGERLGPAELLVLRHKARSLKCQNGPWCDDPQCFYGHHCRFGKGCTNPSCRFADTHHIDLTPAKKIYDDGRVEVFN
ncbi:hypothetical protein VTK73DRAFT_1819 [Phialemonium thermophilum]|uniref:C3H1-type domain-containing protein n=1 Tax=Phialemonium thermophilum TaxID=223376 RepID=A0ABR3VSX7_9PEZI